MNVSPGLVEASPPIATGAPVISFEEVRLGFDEGDVLRDLSFHVAPHETKVLIGESGAGKTLIMKLAAGLIRPDAGRVMVSGQELNDLTEYQLLDFRRRIGFVFQEGALFDSLSVAENVAYRLREEDEPEDRIEARTLEVLRLVEMEHSIDKMPADLSGGMRRRVSIARALASAPYVVFYDSPTAGLDPITSQTIIKLMLRLRDTQGVTSLLATHRLQDAFGMANYRFDAATNKIVHLSPQDIASKRCGEITFLFIRDGRVYFEGGPQAVLDSTDPYLKKFLV